MSTKGLRKKEGSWRLGPWEIRQCIFAGSKKWYVQERDGDARFDENSCPQFETLREVQEWIFVQDLVDTAKEQSN